MMGSDGVMAAGAGNPIRNVLLKHGNLGIPAFLLIIMAMMFWGRLGALTIVLAVARNTPPQPISYPEEHLLLG